MYLSFAAPSTGQLQNSFSYKDSEDIFVRWYLALETSQTSTSYHNFIGCLCLGTRMRTAIIAILVCNWILPVIPYIALPGDVCTQCCCCVVTSAGTRNFCAWTNGGFQQTTIPNCYYLQSHLAEVLDSWDSGWVGDNGYTISGLLLDWYPTDPAYGCLKDLATVTPTDVALGPTTPIQSSTMSTVIISVVTTTGANGAVYTTTIPPSPPDSGLSLSNQIALGVGIGVGLPATIAAIVMCIKGFQRHWCHGDSLSPPFRRAIEAVFTM